MKEEELASQLRIGNLLYYKGTTNIAKVELIHNKHFDCRDEYGGFTPNGDYEPIPLSEEVVLKCGFDLKSVPYHTIKGNIVLVISNGIWYYKFSYTKVQYLHQLQNLFYSLTQTELEVSL